MTWVGAPPGSEREARDGSRKRRRYFRKTVDFWRFLDLARSRAVDRQRTSSLGERNTVVCLGAHPSPRRVGLLRGLAFGSKALLRCLGGAAGRSSGNRFLRLFPGRLASRTGLRHWRRTLLAGRARCQFSSGTLEHEQNSCSPDAIVRASFRSGAWDGAEPPGAPGVRLARAKFALRHANASNPPAGDMDGKDVPCPRSGWGRRVAPGDRRAGGRVRIGVIDGHGRVAIAAPDSRCLKSCDGGSTLDSAVRDARH